MGIREESRKEAQEMRHEKVFRQMSRKSQRSKVYITKNIILIIIKDMINSNNCKKLHYIYVLKINSISYQNKHYK